ncbi:hypothetical protein [Herbaspirillum sp.]|uniref:hypothetical protein n=1 Tax=Herbaspirillum sp. TaxID=1890675 RepID=UPI001B2E9807|nr:hypothetical protein [Herbaspirillum sp.]MBO9536429.1 hypothetical protein [Herbaspirillum sp.]
MVNPELDCIFHLPVNDLSAFGAIQGLRRADPAVPAWRICQTENARRGKVSHATSFHRASPLSRQGKKMMQNSNIAVRHAPPQKPCSRYCSKRFRLRISGSPDDTSHVAATSTAYRHAQNGFRKSDIRRRKHGK